MDLIDLILECNPDQTKYNLEAVGDMIWIGASKTIYVFDDAVSLFNNYNIDKLPPEEIYAADPEFVKKIQDFIEN